MSPRLTFTLTATAMLASCGTPNRAPDDALRSRDAKIAQQARRIAELEATADRNRRDAAANGAVQGMTDALNSSDAKEQLADAEVRAEVAEAEAARMREEESTRAVVKAANGEDPFDTP